MKKILTLISAVAFLAACQTNEHEGVDPVASQVVIDPVITRATEVNFEENDQIGLTILRGAESYAENSLLTFADGVFSGNLTWYAEAAETSTLVAYYPYDKAGAPSTFTVVADQSGEGYGASDLMGSTKADVLPSASAVSMTFKHLLTKFLVNVENESGAKIEQVIFRGSIPTATVDLKELKVEVAEGAAADIRAQEVEADKTYRAIVVPQTVAFELVVETNDGKTLTQSLASLQMTQGGQYTVNVRVLSDGLKVVVSGEIENWTDEGEVKPADDEVPFEEFLDEGYFVYDGERYNIVKLANNTIWMAEPLRYIPDGITPSEDPQADAHMWYPYKLNNTEATSGTINAASATPLTDAESIKKNGYFYDVYAALGGVEVTEANCYDFEGAQGICPKGWHIPTRTEFWNLCGLSNKAAEGETGNQINENALFYDKDYGGGLWKKYNEAGWNYVLSGVRMMTNFNSEPRYQLTQLYSGNNSLGEEYYGTPGLTYIMSSTCYKPIYTNEVLSNIQFFGQMTTFTKAYPEGRINLAYVSIESGQQVRCVRDSAE